jgi:hypothetical protein
LPDSFRRYSCGRSIIWYVSHLWWKNQISLKIWFLLWTMASNSTLFWA